MHIWHTTFGCIYGCIYDICHMDAYMTCVHVIWLRYLDQDSFWIRDRWMPGAIDKSFWSLQKCFSSECIEIKVSTDCPPKIPRLVHFWASWSYQSQNSVGYTPKYSQLTHRVKSTKTELIDKSTPIARFHKCSCKWNRVLHNVNWQKIFYWRDFVICSCNVQIVDGAFNLIAFNDNIFIVWFVC